MCRWVQELKMSDSYASNLGRCVNVEQGMFFEMRSYDCHVFMECLLTIACRELSNHVWKPRTELSEYFRDLCSSIFRVDDLLVIKKNSYYFMQIRENLAPWIF